MQKPANKLLIKQLLNGKNTLILQMLVFVKPELKFIIVIAIMKTSEEMFILSTKVTFVLNGIKIHSVVQWGDYLLPLLSVGTLITIVYSS